MKKLISNYFGPFANIALPLWLALAATMVNAVATSIAVFISLYMKTQLGFSVEAIGLVVGALGGGGVLGAYIGGYFSDRMSPTTICITSLFLNGLFLLCLTQGTNFHHLLWIVIFLGASNMSFTPASRVMLLECCEESRRTQISGIRYMLYNFGFGFGILIYGMMADISYPITFVVSGVIVLSMASLLFCYRQHFHVVRKSREKAIGVSTKRWDGQLCLIYLTLILIALIFSQIRSTYAFYLTTVYGLSAQLFSYLFLINSALIVLVQVQLLHFLQRFRQYFIVGVGAVLIGLSMPVLLLGTGYHLAILSVLLWTAGEILFFSTVQVLIYNRAHESRKGKHMGIYQIIYSGSAMLGPVIGGYTYHFFNGALLWVMCGVAGLVCFMIFRGIEKLEVRM